MFIPLVHLQKGLPITCHHLFESGSWWEIDGTVRSFIDETNKRTLYRGVGRVKGTDKDDKAPMGLALLDAIATPWPEGTGRVSGDRKPSRNSSPGEEQPPQVPRSYVEECAIASTLPVGWSRQSKYPGLSLFSPSSLVQLVEARRKPEVKGTQSGQPLSARKRKAKNRSGKERKKRAISP